MVSDFYLRTEVNPNQIRQFTELTKKLMKLKGRPNNKILGVSGLSNGVLFSTPVRSLPSLPPPLYSFSLDPRRPHRRAF